MSKIFLEVCSWSPVDNKAVLIFCNGLVPNRWQVVTLINDKPVEILIYGMLKAHLLTRVRTKKNKNVWIKLLIWILQRNFACAHFVTSPIWPSLSPCTVIYPILLSYAECGHHAFFVSANSWLQKMKKKIKIVLRSSLCVYVLVLKPEFQAYSRCGQFPPHNHGSAFFCFVMLYTEVSLSHGPFSPKYSGTLL